MSFSHDIHSALKNEDIVGLEQIIKKVGAEAAFSAFMTEDFSGRRLMNYFVNYPNGLRESWAGIHPEFLTLGLKYDPWVKLKDRLRYLNVCDSFLSYISGGSFRRTGRLGLMNGVDEQRVVKFRKSILDLAPADEKILMQKLCVIRDKYKFKPER